MPIPKPEPNEQMSEFIERCMTDKVMKEEYPNEGQRIAICAKEWAKK